MPSLNVAHVVDRTQAEGPGERLAVWVQGCPLRCPGCCNPEQLPQVPAASWSPADLAARAVRAGVEGVSLLGGEPMAQAAGLAEFARDARAAGLSVMVYTGYTLDELRASPDPGVAALLAQTDLLLDGRYDRTRPEAGAAAPRRWVGSTNQRLHFLTDRYDPADPCFTAPNTVEFHLTPDGLELNGWPAHGAATGRYLLGVLPR